MSLDPRSRMSVGIDGRQYPRKTKVYIDVLGLPTITEAVHAASKMLRRGIAHAMSSSIEDEQNMSKKELRQKPQTNPWLQLDKMQTPQTLKSAAPDPVSIYSAITQRSKKPATDVETTPTQSTAPASSHALSALRQWNSAKKAGPSILSKRTRLQAAAASSQSVFQPAPKRERRSETSQKHAVSAPTIPQQPQRAAAQDAPPKKATTALPQIRAVTTNSDPRRCDNALKGASMEQSKGAVQNKGLVQHEKNASTKTNSGSSIRAESSAVLAKKHDESDMHTASSGRSGKEMLGKSGTKLSNGNLLPGGVGGRKSGLPASWSQVSSKGVGRPVSALSLLRKANNSKDQKGSTSLPPIRPQMRTIDGVGLAPELAARRATESMKNIPGTTTVSGMQVKYVPGSKTIDGVRPNGYTVSNEGVVKPVITFNPKTKLPYKLRQTCVERLFEAWRDSQHLVEGEALEKALRTEQEMYAECTGRVGYRSGISMKLKEIRK